MSMENRWSRAINGLALREPAYNANGVQQKSKGGRPRTKPKVLVKQEREAGPARVGYVFCPSAASYSILAAVGCSEVYYDTMHLSGNNLSRGLSNALAGLYKSDTLVVADMENLGGLTFYGIVVLTDRLSSIGCTLELANPRMSTATAAGMFSIALRAAKEQKYNADACGYCLPMTTLYYPNLKPY